MRDVDNNLSAVIVEPTLSTSCNISNQTTMMNHVQGENAIKNYSHLRDKLWEVIDKEIGMTQCDIYRYELYN